MERCEPTGKSRDLLSIPWMAFVVFCLPAILIVVAGGSWVSNGWRTAVWTVSLVVLGAACIANAVRCGRVHCYLTGPFFLLMALATLLYGLGVVPLGRSGWNWLSLVILVGAVTLSCVPELVWGKYRKSGSTNSNRP